MSGEKDRFTTVEKLWKLDDKQLSTPEHDGLVLMATPGFLLARLPGVRAELSDPVHWSWDYDKTPISDDMATSRAVKTFAEREKRLPFNYEGGGYIRPYRKTRPGRCERYSSESEERYKERCDEHEKECRQYDADEVSVSKLTEWHREQSMVQVRAFQEFPKSFESFDFSEICSCTHEMPIVGYNRFIIGYWDIVLSISKSFVPEIFGVKYESHRTGIPLRIYIEAKPHIESYGAVLRQIRTYQEYLPRGDDRDDRKPVVCLLTPDTRFKDAFESQGITVISP